MVADSEHEDKRPASHQVADDLQSQISDGDLAPGEPLPTYRTLEQRYGVARNTAHAAVRLLRDRGLVTMRRNARAQVRDPKSNPDIGSELGSARTEVADLRTQAERLSAELQRVEARLTRISERFDHDHT